MQTDINLRVNYILNPVCMCIPVSVQDIFGHIEAISLNFSKIYTRTMISITLLLQTLKLLQI